MSEQPCPCCAGCGRIANDAAGTPWSAWLALPARAAIAVVAGLVKPVTCPACGGSGTVALADPDDLLIWWTSEADCKALGEPFDSTDPDDTGDISAYPTFTFLDLSTVSWPAYLKTQYQSRYGRHGRGRLWVAREFDFDDVTWDRTRVAVRLIDAEGHGGIVVRRADLPLLRSLPGFVTNRAMELV